METNVSVSVNATTTRPLVVITEGEYFIKTEHAAMKIFIWPLIFIFIFAVLGAVGNSIVIYIYWRKWKKNKTRVFILCLAILDWVNCVFNMPVEIAVLWNPLSFDSHYLCKISRGCTFVINNTGSLVLVSIAVERYLLVYYPLKSRQLTPTFAKRMCLLAFIIASSVSWPSFVFYGSHTLSIPVGVNAVVKGKTCLISDEHEFRTGLILIFTTVLFALLITVFIVLTVLYIAIGRKIYIATCTDIQTNGNQEVSRLFSKSIISALTGVTKPDISLRDSTPGKDGKKYSIPKRNQSTVSMNDTSETEESTLTLSKSNSSEQFSKYHTRPQLSRKFSTVKTKATMKNTVMMRMVTIAFMMSFTPFLCILIIRYTNPLYYLSLNDPGKIAYHVFLRTYFINSMLNPFIYGFMDLYFRRLVKDLFSKLFCSKCCAGT